MEIYKRPKGKRAEKRSSSKMLLALLDNISDSIYFKDKKCRFMLVSRSKAERAGVAPEDAIGKTDFDFYPERQARGMFKDDMHVLTTGEPIVERVEMLTRPNGRTRWVSVTKVPLRNRVGEIVGVMGISRDITERKQAEDTLHRDMVKTLVHLKRAYGPESWSGTLRRKRISQETGDAVETINRAYAGKTPGIVRAYKELLSPGKEIKHGKVVKPLKKAKAVSRQKKKPQRKKRA